MITAQYVDKQILHGLIELLIHAQVMYKNVNISLTYRYSKRIAYVYKEIASQNITVNINQSVHTEETSQKYMSQNPQKSSNHVCRHIRNTTHKQKRLYVNCTKTNAASQHYCHVKFDTRVCLTIHRITMTYGILKIWVKVEMRRH